MLTSDLSIVHYDRGVAVPDRLTRVTHRHYLDYALRMLAIYRSGIGATRQELHRSIRNILAAEPDCSPRRIAAFAKILDDASEFDRDRKSAAAKLRLRVFELAAKMHPLVGEPDQIFERSESEAKHLIAREIGQPWDAIDARLYSDCLDHQPLQKFEGFDSPELLLSRYNLAQLQACLYRARRMTVDALADFAAVIRFAKLSRLLIETRRLSGDRYRIELTGPASILQETRRYGLNFARFVGALVSCREWSMLAMVRTPWNGDAQLRITSNDGYRSRVTAPPLFDSEVEQTLSARWGETRKGWRLIREAGILQAGQLTFVPDFRLRHVDGREIFLEIVGFWTPEYLASKRKTLQSFSRHRILLAVAERQAKVESDSPGLVLYKTRIDPDAVVRAAEKTHPPSAM